MKGLTQLEKVAFWHKLAGVEANPEAGAKQIDFYYSEMDEYEEAKTLSDEFDAIGDMLFVKLGYEYHTGIVKFEKTLDLVIKSFFDDRTYHLVDCIFEEVLSSNMTKFCESEGEALATQLYYINEKCLETYISKVGDYYIIKSYIDQLDKKGKFSFKGKVLKSVKFKEPDFTQIIKEYLMLLTHNV